MAVTFNQLYKVVGKAIVGSKITIELLFDADDTETLYAVHVHSPLTHQLQFVDGTVKINSVLAPSGTTNTTIPLPDVIDGGSYHITFDAIIMDDTPNPIEFTSTVEYLPLDTLKRVVLESNQTSIPIIYNNVDILGTIYYQGYHSNNTANTVYIMDIHPELKIETNESEMKVNDEYELLYTITNNSNITMDHMTMTTTKTGTIEFVSGSVEIDGILDASIDVNLPINLYTLGLGEVRTLKLKFKVINASTRKVSLFGTLNYDYYVNGTSTTISCDTDTIYGYVYDYTISVTQQVSQSVIQLFDTQNFTIVVKNTGNDTVTNVTVYDVVPEEVTIVPTSILVNSNSVPYVDLSTGLSIGTLNISDTTTVTFAADVDGIDHTPIDVTNAVSVQFDDDIGIDNKIIKGTVKAKDLIFTIYSFVVSLIGYSMPQAPQTVRLDENIYYSYSLKNIGNITAGNVILTDILPDNTEFVQGSVYIDGTQSSQNPNLGITIPNLIPGQLTYVYYQAKVKDYFSTATPTLPQVANFAYLTSDASVKGTTITRRFDSTTIVNPIETVYLTINSIVGEPIIVDTDELVTYTVIIDNTGITDAKNIEFMTTANPLVQFVTGSVVKVEGSTEIPTIFGDPEKGWTIPLIAAKTKITYKYKVKVL